MTLLCWTNYEPKGVELFFQSISLLALLYKHSFILHFQKLWHLGEFIEIWKTAASCARFYGDIKFSVRPKTTINITVLKNYDIVIDGGRDGSGE